MTAVVYRACDLIGALLLIAAISALLVIVRLAFLYVAVYLIRLIDRRLQQRLRRVSNRSRVVSGLAGFRGAVSLAVALSVPATLHSGRPFPDRNLIIFVTSGVIVLTLLQALVLPRVVRWARLPRDTSVDEERQLAETTAVEEAFAALPRAAADLGTPAQIVDRLRAEYETHLLVLHADRGDTSTRHFEDEYDALRLALLPAEQPAPLCASHWNVVQTDAPFPKRGDQHLPESSLLPATGLSLRSGAWPRR